MESEIRSWELVENLFDSSVSPERLHELIAVWDSQIERSGLGHVRLADAAGSAFALQVAGVLQVLEQVQAAELRRVSDLLSTMLGAAMVLADDDWLEVWATAADDRPTTAARARIKKRMG